MVKGRTLVESLVHTNNIVKGRAGGHGTPPIIMNAFSNILNPFKLVRLVRARRSL